MNLLKGECITCGSEVIIESISKICYECAGDIREGIKNHESYLKGIPILEKGRGKWFFCIEESGEYSYVAFTPKKYWDKEDCFCYYEHLSEEDQEYLNYVTGDMGLSDELNFELDCTVEEARERYKKLGMIELNPED